MYRLKKVSKIAFHKFAGMQDNPEQRPTEKHAKKASKEGRHLSKADPTHAMVKVAVCLENRETYKVDGHTRCFLWERGSLRIPPHLYAEYWECDTLEDVKSLYRKSDSPDPVPTTSENIGGIYSSMGFNPQSSLCKTAAFSAFFRLVAGPKHNKTKLPYLLPIILPYLKTLDTWDFRASKKCNMCGTAAASLLITYIVFGEEILPFWKDYQDQNFNQNGKEKCPASALHNKYLQLCATTNLNTGDGPLKFLTYSLMAISHYRKNQTFSSGLRPKNNKEAKAVINAASEILNL